DLADRLPVAFERRAAADGVVAQEPARRHSKALAVAAHELRISDEQPLEAPQAAATGGRGALQEGHQLFQGAVGHLEPELVLALEVQIEGALAELRLPRDLIHRRGAEPLLQEHPLGGIQNAAATLVFFALPPLGDPHWALQ